jgi:hypothetical protein
MELQAVLLEIIHEELARVVDRQLADVGFITIS